VLFERTKIEAKKARAGATMSGDRRCQLLDGKALKANDDSQLED
jgi:hypothetical protein